MSSEGISVCMSDVAEESVLSEGDWGSARQEAVAPAISNRAKKSVDIRFM